MGRIFDRLASIMGGSEGPKVPQIRLLHRETSLGELDSGTLLLTLVGSPDRSRAAYWARRGPKCVMVLDGKISVDAYDLPRLADFSRNRQEQFLKAFGTDAEDLTSTGGLLSHPLFSPDSRRLAYAAHRGGKQLVVVDGEEGDAFDEIVAGTLGFSPDSRRVVYDAARDGKFVIVLDGESSDLYDDIAVRDIRFSPDSRRVAYWARRGNKSLFILDGQEKSTHDAIAALSFSPDSRRWAFSPERRGHWLVVVDEVESELHDRTVSGTPLFSPDSRRLAYGATSRSQSRVFVEVRREKRTTVSERFVSVPTAGAWPTTQSKRAATSSCSTAGKASPIAGSARGFSSVRIAVG